MSSWLVLAGLVGFYVGVPVVFGLLPGWLKLRRRRRQQAAELADLERMGMASAAAVRRVAAMHERMTRGERRTER